MASLLPRGVSENKDSSARHSPRTPACSAATQRTADSLLAGHDISVFWFSSDMEKEKQWKIRIPRCVMWSVTSNRTALATKSIKVSGCRFVNKKLHKKFSDTSPQPSVICTRFYQMLKAQSEVFDLDGLPSKSEAASVCFPSELQCFALLFVQS